MSVGNEASVAPPGWVPPAQPTTPATVSPARDTPPAVPSVAVVAGQPATEAALRWRFSAAVIDSFLVGGVYTVLCLLAHWTVLDPLRLLGMLAGEMVYFTALEARNGQTLGKRQYGLRVVALDGSRASLKAVALRSALRPIDRLPAWYASGLINMVRTGAQRRQRIGDVAAGTIVVAGEGLSARRGTPGWMLPVATLASVAVSLLFVYGITQAGSQPLSATQQAEFVAGCNQGAGALVDCECLLTRLEGQGYTSFNALHDLYARVGEERAAGTPGPSSAVLRAAVLACRR